MKFGKASIVVLIVGLFLIGAFVLYTLWQDEVDREDALTANLDTARALLPPVQASVTDAQAALDSAQADLADAQAKLNELIARFPTPPPAAAIQTIDYGTQLFILAGSNTLNLSELHASEPSQVTIDGIKYQSTDMDIKVAGAIDKINDFLGNLETSDPYLTATIDSVNVTFSHEFDQDLGAVPPPEAIIFINILALES